MLPPFHGERMRAYEGTIAAVAATEVEGWPRGDAFELRERMQAITLEVILAAVFGVAEGERHDRLRDLLGRVLEQTRRPLASALAVLTRPLGRFGPYAPFQRLLDETDAVLATEIADRRRDPRLGEREDILSMLVAARFADGSAMDDRDIRDQLMTLLLAGHETTATALAWAFDLLLRHPPALERLRTEVDAGEQDYLRAVIAESLRLRPVIPLAGRRLRGELQVDGFTLPAGTDVTPAIWLTHTREDLYPAPLEFRPERFLDSAPETYAWIPFGGGVRRCLGASFAEFEMRIVLRETLRRCELRGARRRPEGIARRNITFSPRHGTPVVVSPRS
jgi:cytochrome P450